VSPAIAAIMAALGRLRRRERALFSAELLAVGVAAAAAALLALTVAWNLGWVRPGTGRVWIALVTLGALAGLAWRASGWARLGDLRRAAVHLESAAPDLRGGLLTVYDRTVRPLGSASLLERLARQIEPQVLALPPTRVLPARGLVRSLVASLAAVMALVLGAALLPAGPIDALAAMVHVSTPPATPTPPAGEGQKALVGDIRLRYLYPTYTGLEPLDVPNATGDVHAPPGTVVEIRARTAVRYESAVFELALVAEGQDVPGEPAVSPAELQDGRDLAASFTLTRPGIWRFRFGELPSPDYRIVPDPDLPPDVTAQVRSRTLSAPRDGLIPFTWTAKDDFGLTKVVMEVKQGGRTREVELRTPADVPRTLGERVRLTPADLGLAAGDRVTLRVKAWDNDEVSGSKPGWSAPIDLEVMGTKTISARANGARRELRDALVRVLAAFLVEPSPVAATTEAAANWSSVANTRYEEVDGLLEGFLPIAAEADRAAVDEVLERRRALLSFARTAGAGGRLSTADLDTQRDLQGGHIEAVEGAILLLDDILRAAAQAEVAELTQRVADEAAELNEDLSELGREEALARLDQLERLLRELMEAAARLGEGELKEFLNSRTADVSNLMEEVRKAIAEGRTEDAAELMKRVSEQLRELAAGLQDQQNRRGEAHSRLQEAMEKLEKELEALEKDQAALRKETESARERFGQDMDEAVKMWEEVERRSGELATALRGIDDAVRPSDLPNSIRMDVADRRADAEGLLDSARARDLETALDRSQRLEDGLLGLEYGLGVVPRRVSDPAARNLALLTQKQMATQRVNVKRIRELLEKMQSEQQRTSPALQQELERLAAQQQQIEQRAGEAADAASKMAPTLPMKAPGLREGAERGAEQAGRAAEAMREGDAMSAEGGQRAAEDAFREAREALDQARQTMQSMQEAASGEGEGQPRDPNGEQEGMGEDQQVALPAPEEFQTPEAYRAALLEGMSGAVPEEYESLNQRYYEELVRQ